MNERPGAAIDNKLRTRLERPVQGSDWRRLGTSLAMLVFVVALSQFYAQKKIVELYKVGVDDHVHCAIAGTYPHQTQRVEMTEGLGPEFAPMLQPVIDAAADGRAAPDPVESAHRCTVNGRAYVHIILRRDKTLISLILTKRTAAEIFPRSLSAHIVHAPGVPIHAGSLDGYAVASFESGAWLGYVVSGLPAAENDALSIRLAPVVQQYAR